ncbi:MAG: GC-type dockerin domain-anchored protein [Phycisphaerales bacterium JB060]
MDTRACMAAVIGIAIGAPALAQESVSIDLAGVELKDGQDVSRDSAPDTISPATRYHYEISGMVQGSGVVLGTLFPNPTPLADALEQLSPGSSDFLMGEVDNPDGTHPFQVLGQMFEGEQELVGITVRFSATFDAGIGADDVAFFNITDVVLSPSFLVGSLEFTEGAAVIGRIESVCRADIDGDGSLTLFDFLAFQNAFDMGDPIADFDGDGELTLFDFLAFQNAFDMGCE